MQTDVLQHNLVDGCLTAGNTDRGERGEKETERDSSCLQTEEADREDLKRGLIEQKTGGKKVKKG